MADTFLPQLMHLKLWCVLVPDSFAPGTFELGGSILWAFTSSHGFQGFETTTALWGELSTQLSSFLLLTWVVCSPSNIMNGTATVLPPCATTGTRGIWTYEPPICKSKKHVSYVWSMGLCKDTVVIPILLLMHWLIIRFVGPTMGFSKS